MTWLPACTAPLANDAVKAAVSYTHLDVYKRQKIYFKLNVGGKFRFAGYDMEQAMSRYGNQYIDYHIEFFGNGLNAVIKKWLENDCRETPEEIFSIIQTEYIWGGYREWLRCPLPLRNSGRAAVLILFMLASLCNKSIGAGYKFPIHKTGGSFLSLGSCRLIAFHIYFLSFQGSFKNGVVVV